MFTYDNSDGMYHANSVAFSKDGNGHFMKPKTHDTVGYELDWYNNGIITEEGGKQHQAKGKEKREWQKFKKEYELVDDPDRPNFYMYRKRSLKKPKFAPGKDDDDIIFGEVPYPLYDQYGNLLDLNTGAIGTTALPNVEVVANPEDVARGNNRRAEEMAKQWYKDFGTESNDATSVADGRRQNSHLDGRGRSIPWGANPVLNTIGLGLSAVPFAVAAYPGAVVGGELLGTTLANPYVDAGLTSVFAAHGLNHWLNEGITDWKDGVMTALEVTPLGRLVKPIYAAGETAGEAVWNSTAGQYLRYPIGKLKYGFDAKLPTLYRKIKGGVVPTPQNGRIMLTNPHPRFGYADTGEVSPEITNFTYDTSVRSHSRGDWDSGFTIAVPGKTLLGKNVVSTEPSDVFTFGSKIQAKLKDATILSGDAQELATAK